MVTGIYLRLVGVAVDGMLDMFVGSSSSGSVGGGNKSVIGVLEQLASIAKDRCLVVMMTMMMMMMMMIIMMMMIMMMMIMMMMIMVTYSLPE